MYKKVSPGDPLVIPAVVYNAIIDEIQNNRVSFSSDFFNNTDVLVRGRGALCRVKNTTGGLVHRFGVLGIDGNIHTVETGLDEMRHNPVLIGVVPSDEHYGRFCVTIEPIGYNNIGMAVYAGCILTKVRVHGSLQNSFQCADVRVGNTQTLQAVPNGGARILWIEESADPDDPDHYERWAFVRIDTGNYEEFVQLTSTTPDASGFYDGVVQVYEISSGTWIDKFDCKCVDIGG